MSTAITVVDGGSTDDTATIATAAGATVIAAAPGRGAQLAAGAAAATHLWLMFVHADTALAHGWDIAVASFMTNPDMRENVGVFQFRLDDVAPAAKRLERIVAWRTKVLALPYGDQGLVMSRATYAEIGGFRTLPIMEDVDLVRRIPKGRLHVLPATAITSADRYRQNGYVLRPLRNLLCQGLWRLGVPAETVARLYR